jgi:hypothetical protein
VANDIAYAVSPAVKEPSSLVLRLARRVVLQQLEKLILLEERNEMLDMTNENAYSSSEKWVASTNWAFRYSKIRFSFIFFWLSLYPNYR